MNKKKQPTRRYRTFDKYPVQQVIEVAQMLYALRPFKIDKDTLQWKSLAREAFNFLDKLSTACAEIAEQRRLQDEAYRTAEKRVADAEDLPPVVPFDKAMRVITGERETGRARPKFISFVRAHPAYFGLPKEPHENKIKGLMSRLQKNGMPVQEVLELQRWFKDKWPGMVAALQSDKAKTRTKRGAYQYKRPKEKQSVVL